MTADEIRAAARSISLEVQLRQHGQGVGAWRLEDEITRLVERAVAEAQDPEPLEKLADAHRKIAGLRGELREARGGV